MFLLNLVVGFLLLQIHGDFELKRLGVGGHDCICLQFVEFFFGFTSLRSSGVWTFFGSISFSLWLEM